MEKNEEEIKIRKKNVLLKTFSLRNGSSLKEPVDTVTFTLLIIRP